MLFTDSAFPVCDVGHSPFLGSWLRRKTLCWNLTRTCTHSYVRLRTLNGTLFFLSRAAQDTQTIVPVIGYGNKSTVVTHLS